jgi:hypothetical protein
VATKQELEDRIAKLERERFQDTHIHTWRYSKCVTVYPKDGSRSVFWSWKCASEACHYGSGGTNHISWKCAACDCGWGGTNHIGGLPAHFPDDLR